MKTHELLAELLVIPPIVFSFKNRPSSAIPTSINHGKAWVSPQGSVVGARLGNFFSREPQGIVYSSEAERDEAHNSILNNSPPRV